MGLRWAGDATSIVLLIAVLWWLASHDGGFERVALAKVGLLAVVAVPAAAAELRRTPRSVRVLTALWTAGLIVSLVFAAERSRFTHDAITYALVPVVGLVAHRLWRRRWGPPVLATLLLVSFGLYWYEAFLSWWGLALMEGRQPVWRVLSWHNQSGTLMAAFGLIFAGVALNGRRVVAAAFGTCAAAAFAGAWLAGSRGAVVVLVLGVVVLVAVSARARGVLISAARISALGLATLAVVGGLLWYAGIQSPATDDDVARVASVSGEPAGGNFALRFRHMEAAVGMFFDAPLTGQGIGSYRNMAPPFTSPESNLTSSAHNEYAEVLGEGGLALAVPFLGLAVLGILVGWRRYRSADRGLRDLGEEVGTDDLRWPLSLGAVGMVAALLVHQGADFDWGYPVLPALLAIGIATAGRDARAPVEVGSGRRGIAGVATAVGLVGLLLVGSVGALWQARSLEGQSDLSAEEVARVPVAWDVERASQAASNLVRSGQYEHARWTLQRAISWNPGYYPARVDLAIVDHAAGDTSGRELVDVLFDGYVHFASANKVSAALIGGGEYELAESVLRAFLDLYPRYEAWDINAARAYSWFLLVQAAAEGGGCPSAERAAAEARAADGMGEPEHLEPIDALVETTCG